MNLHLVPDNSFIDKFYDNLSELNILDRNRIVVRTPHHDLRSIRHELPFAKLYTPQWDAHIGDTFAYDKVFIHYFTPLLYRWVARHRFRELNWMVWGGDLYNLPGSDDVCHEPFTKQYVDRQVSVASLLLKMKMFANRPFRTAAYRKVSAILTWMTQEYAFARKTLPVNADHRFFFYENRRPYQQLPQPVLLPDTGAPPVLMIGNSGTPANNHIDAVRFLEDRGVAANLVVPVAYGDAGYIRFLRKRLTYRLGNVSFMDQYMPFDQYVEFLHTVDGIVMNSIRPQGYGNILMMVQMGKPVFLHPRNISLPDLDAYGIPWHSMESLAGFRWRSTGEVKNNVMDLFSHDRLLATYAALFG